MLRTCLSEHDVAWDAVELDQGEAIPDLNDYDALWVMGGRWMSGMLTSIHG